MVNVPKVEIVYCLCPAPGSASVGSVAGVDEAVLQRFTDILDLLPALVLHDVPREEPNFKSPLVLPFPPIVLGSGKGLN